MLQHVQPLSSILLSVWVTMFLTCIKVSSAALATLLAAHPYVALKHYYYTVIEPTTLNPPPPMSLLFIDYSPTALRSTSGWQTFFRVWRAWTSAYLRCDTQACVRRQRRTRPQKAVRPVTQRSQEWLMGGRCHQPACSCTESASHQQRLQLFHMIHERFLLMGKHVLNLLAQ